MRSEQSKTQQHPLALALRQRSERKREQRAQFQLRQNTDVGASPAAEKIQAKLERPLHTLFRPGRDAIGNVEQCRPCVHRDARGIRRLHSPARHSNSVVFPARLGPIRPSSSFSRIENDRSSNALTFPNFFRMPSTSTRTSATIYCTACYPQVDMDADQLRSLLEDVRTGSVNIDAALDRMRHLPFEDLGYAKLDHHRSLRHGITEVIFGKGKTPDQVTEIAQRLLEKSRNLLITRTDTAVARRLEAVFPETEFFPLSGAVRIWRDRTVQGKGKLAVVCAGTSDIPVAEETKLTAEVMGNQVEALYDVGVAGIHRLIAHSEQLMKARVVVVVAGMEGALPSVVGGLVSAPVIAVPTSVGYGASFQGVAALLGMLNSCASNVAVVNIDNGFGAGYVASLINRL
jgi:pyridinium-3,5-biscarboxylic acid mononucleotide synthase